ncbi:hypothetical protein GALL_311710 [mine drainage metagenome]|uniref:Uncharacterized protein n=1 Tax=mine drainage metagenome TaxID=410659 RepID=A0A1J5QU20_9ZZZZ
MQGSDEVLGIIHQAAFGNLKLQASCFQAGIRQHVCDHLHQPRLAELSRRNIHRHRDGASQPLFQLAGLAAGRQQRPEADLFDQPGFFGNRDEAGRQHHRLTGRLPADQGLRAAYPASGEIDLGLIMEQKLLVLDRPPQPVLDIHAFHQHAVELAREVLEIVAPGLLGLVHGRVGLLEQIIRVAPVIGV